LNEFWDGMMNLETILVTGAHGLLGTSIVSQLNEIGCKVLSPKSSELNLLDEKSVVSYVTLHKPTYVIHLASMVYGLQGNLKNQLSSLSTNNRINDNLFTALVSVGCVKKVFFAGTVASYPYPYVSLPLREDQLLSGLPHVGEFGYACSKITAYYYLNLLKKYHSIDFVYGVFTNMFGPNDKFDIENGHVVPSLISKAYSAKLSNSPLTVWGNPNTTRDFMFVEDAAMAAIFLCKCASGIFNIASGEEVTMGELAETIAKVSSLTSGIEWQENMPVGIPARSVDIEKLKIAGFVPKTGFKEGIRMTFDWYSKNINSIRS
jgi:GDP-L-fucose synthase